MKRLIILLIVSVAIPSVSNSQYWWDNIFVIGMMFNPPMLDSETTQSSYQKALDAGFNLFTGDFIQHNSSGLYRLYHDVAMPIYRSDSVFFFAPRWLLNVPPTEYDGRNCKDEPNFDDYDLVRDSVAYYHATYPTKLCYVNLFPFYKYNDWNTFSHYLDLFCDSINTSVVSFDNYYQHAYFLSPQPDCSNKRYFSNLSEMRKRAGNRPLWSWVMATDWVSKKDSLWQRAYLRLGCFAPIAYGAKGLLCYSYDCDEQMRIPRIFDYRSSSSQQWVAPIYYSIPKGYADNSHLFFGNFWPKNSCDHSDIAVKTDENLGTWRFKHVTDSSFKNKTWDITYMYQYGTESNSMPVLVMDNPTDKIAAITTGKRFLLATQYTSWNCKSDLPSFRRQIYDQLSGNRIVAGKHSENAPSGYDLCIAWQDSIRIYANLDTISQQFTEGYYDYKISQTVFQLMASYSTDAIKLFAIGQGSGSNGWTLYTYNWKNHIWNSQSLQGTNIQYADHFWVEEYGDLNSADSTVLYMQLNQDMNSRIYWQKLNNQSTITFNQLPESYTRKKFNMYGLRNVDGKYDLYGRPIADLFNPAVVDTYQDTTIRYGFLKDINRYVRQKLAPIVMNCQWKGCYHAMLPPDERDSLLQMIEESAVISSMSAPLMAGVFEENDSSVYLMLVNKSNLTLTEASVCLRGRKYAMDEMIPRIDTNSSSWITETFTSDSWMTKVKWGAMTPGECVVLKLKRKPNYFRIHRNSFFDGDDLADINHRFSNTKWCIDYSGNGLSGFDWVHPQYGNDTNSFLTLADYDGDSLTDLSVFTLSSDEQYFLVDYANNTFGSWNLSLSLGTHTNYRITYIGNFDNDGKADFGYVDENSQKLRIRYSGNWNSVHTYVGPYGNTTNTRAAIADYDGDGLDEMAIYNFNNSISKLRVDYNYSPTSGTNFGWDTDYPLSYISSSYRAYIQLEVSDYDGDGKADFAYYNPMTNQWIVDLNHNGFGSVDLTKSLNVSTANKQTRAVASDYDGDGLADMSLYVYDSNTVQVYIWLARDAYSQQYTKSYTSP